MAIASNNVRDRMVALIGRDVTKGKKLKWPEIFKPVVFPKIDLVVVADVPSYVWFGGFPSRGYAPPSVRGSFSFEFSMLSGAPTIFLSKDAHPKQIRLGDKLEGKFG